jgi:hypothetical protein
MGHLNEHFDADGAWQAVSAAIARLGRVAPRAFGHLRQRRLGLRVETSCWALLSHGPSSHYAMAVELSGTGAVLQFFGRERGLKLPADERYSLHLFLPMVSAPLRAVVRPVRSMPGRQAFEFVELAEADRLTLAEHLDRLLTQPARRSALESARRRSS